MATGNRYYHYATNNYLLSTSPDNLAPNTPHYTYDAHGNMTAMPHLANMEWDHADRLQQCAIGGGETVYFTYDANGDRVRKIRVKGEQKYVRLYLGGVEYYREINPDDTIKLERKTLHLTDDTGRIAVVDTLTIDNNLPIINPVPNLRYQLSNHLGSASLELNAQAEIISYEEYYPFGSTSYRSGKNEVEAALKRYRYVGKGTG